MRTSIAIVAMLLTLVFATNEPPTHTTKKVEAKTVSQSVSKPVEAPKRVETPPQPVEPVKTLTQHQTWMQQAGIAEADWGHVEYILGNESGWCPTKWNGQHTCPDVPTENIWGDGGYGLCQSTPATKMASAGSDWKTNPVTQVKWCDGYAQSRYGGWENAHSHWLVFHVW